jgi:type III restriction enzyme
MHSVDEIKTTIHMQNRTVQTILERLFRKQKYSRNKLLSLDSGEFYAFIINNVQILKDTFREVTAGMAEAMSLLPINPKTATFHIPEQDFFKYDSSVKDESVYSSNAYQKYTSGFATSVVRSNSEMLFEQFCEQRKDIKWVYKNGDTGQQYFSVVYVDGLQKQWLFYADYIVMKKDGTIWVIETKGGESRGKNKNIDIQIANKFEAFKEYADKKKIKWGFVRDKDNKLYINNTEFAKSLSDEHWVSLNDNF